MSATSGSQTHSCTLQSPAKINLFLEVTGRRPDGYHDLETVMVRTDLCDTLHFEHRTDGIIRLSLEGTAGPAATTTMDFPLDDSNLIMKAAHRLQQHCGSGNAAATLLALDQLWNLQLPASELHQIAATLGSDLNFLLSGARAALCGGRGEQIRPVLCRGQRHGVLLVPAAGNSTAEIFSALQLPETRRTPDDLIRCLTDGGSLTQLSEQCFNRLQCAAESLNPSVVNALRWLQVHTGNACLTGSGSACFSLVPTAREARQLCARFAAWQVDSDNRQDDVNPAVARPFRI